MAGVRLIVAVLIALSLGLGPVAAAAPCPKPAPQHSRAMMADMEECEHAHGAAHSPAAPSPAAPSKDTGCKLQCCVLKCFKRFVEAPRVEPAATPVSVIYAAANVQTPATRHYTPQPPPPRS